MNANTARKYRLYPDRGQAERLTRWSHTCRTVWNTALAQRIWAYRSARRVTLRAVDQCAELTEARTEHDWLRDLPAQSAQQVLRHLDDAYANFWNPQHPAEFPQFKRKHQGGCLRPAFCFTLRPGCSTVPFAERDMLLTRSIADQGWFEIRRQLGYKTRRHGGELVAVPAPGSSQTCNACGVWDPESRQGCGRLFACVHCGHTEQADRNAALTILDRAFSTAGWAGPAGSGTGRPQSTRSPQGRGTRTGSRLREPTSRTAA